MNGEERDSHNAIENQESKKVTSQLNEIHQAIDENKFSANKKAHKRKMSYSPPQHFHHKHAIYFVRTKQINHNRKRSNSHDKAQSENIHIPKILTRNVKTVKEFAQKKEKNSRQAQKPKRKKPKNPLNKKRKNAKKPTKTTTPKKQLISYYDSFQKPIKTYTKKTNIKKKEKVTQDNNGQEPIELVTQTYQQNKKILVSYKKRHEIKKRKPKNKSKKPSSLHPKKQIISSYKKVIQPISTYKAQKKNEPIIKEKNTEEKPDHIKKMLTTHYTKNRNILLNYKNKQQKRTPPSTKPKKKVIIKVKKQKPTDTKNKTVDPKQLIDKKIGIHKKRIIDYKSRHKTKNQQQKLLRQQKTASKKLYREKERQSGLSEKIIDDFEYGKKNGILLKNKLRKEQQKKKQTQEKQQNKIVQTQPKEPQKLVSITPETLQQIKKEALKREGFTGQVYEEIDFYPLQEPFSYIIIVNHALNNEKHYVIVEAELSEEEHKNYQFLRETLSYIDIDSEELEEEGQDQFLLKKINDLLKDYKIDLSVETKQKITYYLKKDLLGLGILDPIMQDKNIEDVSCDGVNVPIFVYHRIYGSIQTNIVFDEEETLASFVVKLAQKCGKHISIAEPMLDATMPDGSRIQMTLSTEVTAKGSTFTIRKFKEDPFTSSDLIEFNTMNSEMIAYMWLAVEYGVNAIVAGGTAAGKTSTLNALSLFIPRESKIVSIEETRELNLPHPNWIPGVARSGFGEKLQGKNVGEIDLFDLMKAALRQRPEYLLVGEIRGREAYVLFQAMATGHTTYSTVHADSAQSLIHRLEGKPINIPRIMLQSLDIICIQVISRVNNKRARRCKQIIEIVDIDPTTKEILTNEVFRWDPVQDAFMFTGKSYVLEKIRSKKGLSREDIVNELQQRASVLNWMKHHDIRAFKDVATTITQYIEDPSGFLQKMK